MLGFGAFETQSGLGLFEAAFDPDCAFGRIEVAYAESQQLRAASPAFSSLAAEMSRHFDFSFFLSTNSLCLEQVPMCQRGQSARCKRRWTWPSATIVTVTESADHIIWNAEHCDCSCLVSCAFSLKICSPKFPYRVTICFDDEQIQNLQQVKKAFRTTESFVSQMGFQ